MNRRGQEAGRFTYIFPYFFALGIIALMLVMGVAVYHGDVYDSRTALASELFSKASDCLKADQFNFVQSSSNYFTKNFFDKCGISKEVIDADYVFRIVRVNSNVRETIYSRNTRLFLLSARLVLGT